MRDNVRPNRWQFTRRWELITAFLPIFPSHANEQNKLLQDPFQMLRMFQLLSSSHSTPCKFDLINTSYHPNTIGTSYNVNSEKFPHRTPLFFCLHSTQSFDFPPAAPRSCSIGLESAVSAFKLTGSPNWLGFSSNFSIALCLNVLCSPFLCFLSWSPSVGAGATFLLLDTMEAEAEEEAPPSCAVVEGFEVSAFKALESLGWGWAILDGVMGWVADFVDLLTEPFYVYLFLCWIFNPKRCRCNKTRRTK
jgi:hypothetical protein